LGREKIVKSRPAGGSVPDMSGRGPPACPRVQKKFRKRIV
jgi:hypothetical protein